MRLSPRSHLIKRGPVPQAGVSLIEALVTLAILAFGLLGLAMMQLQSMKFNTESYSRSQATLLAYDLMEKMRIYRNNLSPFMTTPTGSCDKTSASIDNERECWFIKISQTLPSGEAVITEPTTGVFQISISWNERVARATGTAEKGITRTQTWVVRP